MSPKPHPWTTSWTSGMQYVPNWTLDTPPQTASQEMATLPFALVQAPHLGVSFISIWLYSRNASTD